MGKSGIANHKSKMRLSQKASTVVTPAKAGVTKFLNFLDSRFHGNDRKGHFLTFYEPIKNRKSKIKNIFYSNLRRR